jgi:hypothetical protein
MKIDRRSLLSATACLAMAKLVGPTFGHPRPSGSDEPPWHPFTRSLLDRARRASSARGPVDTAGVERVIRDTSDRFNDRSSKAIDGPARRQRLAVPIWSNSSRPYPLK